MSAVSIRGLGIEIGPLKIIDDMDLEIEKGEFIVLLGPSGCGKSTLLNAIAGLSNITRGQIWIDGRNVTWSEPKDRGIGMVFQSYSLYPRMSVAQNLSFGLRIAGTPKPEIARRVDKAARLLHLEPLLRRKPAELSGGQRQRVAIGRALVRSAELFLFDEPLSNLDAKLRHELRVEIKQLHLEIGNTMIYVTHDQVEALTLADRIAIMKAGAIEQLATPHDIYHHPANLFVAGFIGTPAMNMIDGHVGRRGHGMDFTHAGGTIDLARYPFAAAAAEGPAILGIRPEHIAISPDGAGQRGQGTVMLVEPMGAETILWTEFAGKRAAIRTDGDCAVRVGETVPLAFDVARTNLFDAASGRRL